MVSLLLSTSLAAASPFFDLPVPVGLRDAPSSKWHESLNETLAAPDETLFRALGLAQVHDLNPSLATRSALLGLSAPASTIVSMYAARLETTPTPLRDALEIWREATGLSEDPAILADQLARADSLPLDLQRAVALLILATTDATRLQNQAVATLSDTEFAFLLNALLSHRPDVAPAPGEEAEAATSVERIERLSSLNDMARIVDGARLLAAAISRVQPTLEPIASTYQAGDAALAPIATRLNEFYRSHPPNQVAGANDYERLSLVVDYVGLIARATRPDLPPRVEPQVLSPHARLRDAIADLAQVLDVPLTDAPVRAQLAAADALPQPLQAALSRLVRAQADLVRALEAQDNVPHGPSGPDAILQVLRYLETLRQTYPTLATYQYVYRLSAPGLSTDPTRQAATVESLRPFLAIMADPATPLADIVSILAYIQGETVPRPVFEPDLDPGALGRAIRQLRALDGHDLTTQEALALQNETASLPPLLESAAARILWAEIAAATGVRSVLENLTPKQQAWFLVGPDPFAQAVADDWVSPSEYADVHAYLRALRDLRLALFRGAAQIGTAIDASRQDLLPYVQPAAANPSPPMGEESASTSSAPDGSSFSPGGPPPGGDGPAPVAPAATVPLAGPAPLSCNPNVPSANCPADILFLGPPRTVVITGPGRGSYNPSVVGGTREHTLWIDLGGDDTYFTAAAGVQQFFVTSFFPITEHPRGVSVMVDLGGNDQYLTPPDAVGLPKQAAVDVVGGIAMLVDDDGSDLYRSDGGIGQAAARRTSLALLIDNAGNDERIVSGFDARGQALATASDSPAIVETLEFGVALLLDRERDGGLGADEYRVSSSQPLAGQAVAAARSIFGIGLGGAAFLIDATGPDIYQGGSQAAVSRSALSAFGKITGLAVLADLAGDDAYSRKTFDGSRPMRNGDCQTSAMLRPEELGNGIPFVDEANPTQPPSSFPLEDVGLGGEYLAIFIDSRDDGSCDPSSLVPSGLVPEGISPDDLSAFVQEKVEDLLSGGLSSDADSDVWPDFLERLTSNDYRNPRDSPAGLPPRPDIWPPGEPYPPAVPDGRRLPNATGFLVDIPGVFALGDAITTQYERNYQMSIDLGGTDMYRNRVASDRESTHLDLGFDADRYEAGDNAQASRGMLFDVGGDDMYLAGKGSQASAPRFQVGSTDRSTDLALLADLAGEDLYVAGPESQGFAEHNCTPCSSFLTSFNPQRVALFLDLQGDDTYRTFQQGVGLNKATSIALDTPSTVVVGAFSDWQGEDDYRVSQQGASPFGGVSPTVSASGFNLILNHFADLEGRDHYRDFTTGIDQSRFKNDRYDASARYGHGFAGSESLYAALRIDVDPRVGANESFRSDPVQNQDDFELNLAGMRIAIGKSTNTTYQGPYALSVDLGGDDVYLNNAGATSFPLAWLYPVRQTNIPPSSFAGSFVDVSASGTTAVRSFAGLALDLGGDDDYDATDWLDSESNLPNRAPGPLDLRAPFGSGPDTPSLARYPGFGRYESSSRLLSQGTGFLGVGMLVDTQGDDHYRAFRYAQGTGVVGVGILWDREGNDRYDYDGGIVAQPAAYGGRLVWSDRREGRWEIYTANPDTAPAVRITPPSDPNLGWRGDHASPVIGGDFVAWSSFFGQDWDLYRFNLKTSATELLFGGPGNQTSSAFHGGSLAYVNDQSGFPAVYILEHIDQSSLFLNPFLVSPSGQPQLEPDVYHEGEDFRAVWTELRPDGTSEIWWKNVGAGLPAERIPGEAHRDRPKIFGPHLTWQQWDPSTSSWDVYYTNLDDPSGQIVPVATGAGDQREPDVVAIGVAYVDDHTHQLRMWYLAGGGPCPVLRESPFGFAQPSFDSGNLFNVYAVRRGTGPSGLGGVYDIVRNSVSDCFRSATVRNLQLEAPGPEFLQGAGLQRGLGALVEEAGNDAYSAWDFAQGATFTNTVASPNEPPSIASNLGVDAPDPAKVGNRRGDPEEQNNRALLLDIDGSDRYIVRNYGQGAHGSTLIVNDLGPVANPGGGSPPNAAPFLGTTYAADQTGILYDLRGRDSYRANTLSQGYAGLTLGSMVLSEGAIQPGNPPPQPNPDLSPFLVNSVGLFLDTGGTDSYDSKPGPRFQMLSVSILDAPGQQPACRSNPAVPGPLPTVPSVPTPSLPAPAEVVCQDVDSSDTLPVDEADDVLQVINQALATPRTRYESQFPPGTAASGDPRNNRDNKVWRQHSIPGTGPGPINAQTRAGPEGIIESYSRLATGEQSTGILFTPGGIGVDMAAYERYAAAFEQAITQFVHMTLKADDQPLSEASPPVVSGVTKLSVDVDASLLANALDLRSVAYAVTDSEGTRPLGVARGRDCPTSDFCLFWDTDSEAWPDGPFQVTARAEFSPKTFAFSVGSVAATGPLVVDNPPRIEPFPYSESVRGVSPAAFSPHPIEFGDDPRPGHADISFLVSRHTNGTPGALLAEIRPRDATDSAPALLTVPGTVNPEGTRFRWQGTWDGRLPDGSVVPSGPYIARFTATDDPARAERTREQRLEVRVEGATPGTTCVRPARLPLFACNGVGDVPAFAASGRIGDAASVPIAWLPDTQVRASSEIAAYHVFHCAPGLNPVCPSNGWTHERLDGAALQLPVPSVKTGEWLLFLVLAEDVFGNLERALPGDASLQQAFERKLGAGELLRARLDLDPPQVAAEVRLRGAVPSVPFFSANTDGVLRATAHDSVSEVTAELLLININGESLSVPLTATTAAGGTTLFTSANLRDLPELEAWPGGIVLYLFTIRDRAGNEALAQGTMLQDPDPPTLRAGTGVKYPEGRAYLLKGDVLQPVIVAADPPTFPNTIGSQTEDLVVTLDAHELNPDFGAYVLPKFRRTALTEFFTGEIPVTLDPPVPEVVGLPFTVVDETGNVAHGTLDVVFGQPAFGIGEPQIVEATHNSLRIQWTTQQLSLGEVRYGLSTRLDHVATEAGTQATTNHEVLLTGLRGQTAYFFRLVARDGHALEELGPIRTASTVSGLKLTLLQPSTENTVYNESFPVRWEALLPADPSQELDYKVEIRPKDTSTFFPMAGFKALPGVHEVLLDPLEFTDGTYEVAVTVRTPTEEIRQLSPLFVLDRRRPQILPELPTPGDSVTTPAITVQARVLDPLSGVDPTSLRLTVNGNPGPVPIYDSATQRAGVDVGSGLHAGQNVLVLFARDRAGNGGSVTWRFVLDQDGPVVGGARALPPVGQSAVKPGDAVVVSARVEDASKIRRVWVEAGNLSSVPIVQLEPRADNRFEATLLVDAPAPVANTEGVVRLPVWAEDVHGFRSAEPGVISVPLDATPPRLDEVRSEPLSVDSLQVRLDASEPVRFLLESAGGHFDPGPSETSAAYTTTVVLRLVDPPAEVVPVRIHLVDAAGHETIVDRGLPTLVASDATPPSPPDALEAASTLDGHVRLRWRAATDDTGILNYLVHRRMDERGFLRVGTAAALSFIDEPPGGRNASYEVRAVDLAGHQGPPSAPVETELRFLPDLTSGSVAPPVGRIDTSFVFRVTYRDPSGRPPDWVGLLLDGVPHPMEGESGYDCSDGCAYWLATSLPPLTARKGPVSYAIEANSGGAMVRFPSTGPAATGPIVLDALPSPADPAGGGVLGHATPAPAGPSVLLVVALVLAQILYLRRKKS